MSAPHSFHPPTAIPFGRTLAMLVAVSALGWLAMVGMVWDMARIMPLSELGPGMAWFSVGRFADYEPSGITRFLDALCITGADPRAMLTDPIHTMGMWLAMAVAMMTPVAFPDLKVYLSLHKTARSLSTLGWLLGFLSIWALAALVVSVLQLALFKTGALGDGMVVDAVPMSTALLLIAGAYQFTSWKTHDRRPCPASCHGSAVASGWFAGWRSVRCCWALMAAMFALGIMNIVAASVLTVLMVAERAHKAGYVCALLGGAALVVYGIMIMVA